LRQEGQATAVWVYDPATSTVKSQVVQIATADGNDAVVASGLTPGMQVVATGVHVLSPGQKVMVYQQKTAVAPVNQAPAATNSVANRQLLQRCLLFRSKARHEPTNQKRGSTSPSGRSTTRRSRAT
jgi:hypothetical protein